MNVKKHTVGMDWTPFWLLEMMRKFEGISRRGFVTLLVVEQIFCNLNVKKQK